MLGFSVVCHICGQILYEGNDLIPLYRLRRKTDGKCPGCGRKLSVDPLSISFREVECAEDGLLVLQLTGELGDMEALQKGLNSLDGVQTNLTHMKSE